MRRRRALFAGSALGVAVVLGGCESAADPTPSATTPSATISSASPTPSPSPTPTETSTIPAAARKNTPEGAEAFVRYFVAQSARAWTQANPDLVTSLSDSKCDSCANLAERAAELKTAKQRYQEAPITLDSARALAGDTSRINVAAVIVQHEVNVISQAGEVVSTDEADKLQRTFLLYWREDQWLVGGIA